MAHPGYRFDSLWSVDLFRCESINLRSYWVMVAMDVASSGPPILRPHSSLMDQTPAEFSGSHKEILSA